MPWFNKKIIKIDVKKIDRYDDKTKQLIADFLAHRQQQKKKDGIAPKCRIKGNKPYKVGKDKSGKDIYLQFNCTFIKYERDNPAKGFTFKALDGKILGEGGYGWIQESNTQISTDREMNGLKIKHKPQVDKVQFLYNRSLRRQMALKEAQNNNKIFSHAKKNCVFTKDDYVHCSMPKIEGRTLSRYFRYKTITVIEAIGIWSKIIEKLKEANSIELSHIWTPKKMQV